MRDPIGSHGVTNVDRALRREAQRIAERFPQVDRATIDRGLGEAYRRLAETATVHVFLVTIAGRIFTEELVNGTAGALTHAG